MDRGAWQAPQRRTVGDDLSRRLWPGDPWLQDLLAHLALDRQLQFVLKYDAIDHSSFGRLTLVDSGIEVRGDKKGDTVLDQSRKESVLRNQQHTLMEGARSQVLFGGGVAQGEQQERKPVNK